MIRLYNKKNLALAIWLSLICMAVIIMIFVGGLTRLTDSGLSITEWKPISGIIPPLNADAWMHEFASYKESPEYKVYNYDMLLNEFKAIFWLEFIHRILGRLTVLLYIIPLMFFWFFNKIKKKNYFTYVGVFGLFLLQGFMGWYMVKSGLVNKPDVSHYRLAMHLLLAVFIYSILFWQLMQEYFDIILIAKITVLRLPAILLIAAIILVICQIIIGAFVAGLDAGLVYNQFPLMGNSIIPEEFATWSFSLQLFADPIFVQFLHRIVAAIILLQIIITAISMFGIDNNKLKRVAIYICLSLLLQIILGIITLIYQVPIAFALLHQLGSILLLSMLLWGLFLVKNA
ncbi:MAG: COX15/CtaA family protein [Rickettsiaceae bacterium]|nr:COX15/CtaA family protein [Rickettsiaceae bacterium]